MVWYGVYGAGMGYMGQCTTAGLHRGCVYGPPSTGYMEHHSRDGEWANTVTLVVVDKEVDEEGEDKEYLRNVRVIISFISSHTTLNFLKTFWGKRILFFTYWKSGAQVKS